jgi:uncharacterized caspase-like protein
MRQGARFKIVVLDACRNNPLAEDLKESAARDVSSAIGRGLARDTGPGWDFLISFSTQPGNVALDGDGRSSPFAGALVRHLSAIDVNNDFVTILGVCDAK